MSKLNPKDYEDFDMEGKSEKRSRKIRKGKFPRDRSFAVKEKKAADRRASKEARIKESEEKLIRFFSRFPSIESDEGGKQVSEYLEWVKDSREQGLPVLIRDDIEFQFFVSSVKAGGQKRQKKRSAVRAIHSPTLIKVKNEDQRSREQNVTKAVEALFEPLGAHLALWKTLVGNKDSFDQIEARVIKILRSITQKEKEESK